MEQVFAIFANVLRFDDNGEPSNFKYAQRRAALYLYGYCNGWDSWPESDPSLTHDETERPSSPNVI